MAVTGNEIVGRAASGVAVLTSLILAEARDERWLLLAFAAGTALIAEAIIGGVRAYTKSRRAERRGPAFELWSDLEPSGD
jgi:hypothetical protein